ncbi:MAG: YkgJ family cysteine cluster protein [Methylococcales bacterium]|nr:YkgJ family cysteine cluster protein [Methylococcales bacterium]
MEESEYTIEHRFATKNFEKVTLSIPRVLIEKEDKLLQRFMKNKRNSLKKLRLLYEFMDNIFKHVNKNTPCQKGCNSCCHYNVSISELEVQFIEKETNFKRIKTNSFVSNFHGVPCPFLKQGVCSIYNSRPFVCRRYISLGSSNKWCEVDIANEYEFPLLNFSEIDKSYAFLLTESELSNVSDIRQQFKT